MLEIGMVEDGDLDGYLVRRSEWTGNGVKWRFRHPMVEFVKMKFLRNKE